MGNKTGLITPFFMLLAGAIAAIIMYVRGFDLTTMLWGLLIVLVVFYIIGDVARYLYASIRPRIIPTGDLEMMVQKAKQNGDLTGSVVAFANDEQKEGMDPDGFMSESGILTRSFMTIRLAIPLQEWKVMRIIKRNGGLE